MFALRAIAVNEVIARAAGRHALSERVPWRDRIMNRWPAHGSFSR